MLVLVLDDNPDDRELEIRQVKTLFPKARIVEVRDFAALESELDANVPDLVLTDLDLRWSNGGDVLATVKARYPTCPVVMFTGTGNEEIAVDLMKAGLDDYVVKSPRQLSRLRTSLKIAVEMAKSRAALSDREVRLTRALAQQQVLVRELHHRVKNNLQTISNMLHIHGRTLDKTTRGHLDEIADRMDALGAVQSRIYDSAQFDHVNFCEVLADIANTLVGIYRQGKVTLTTRFLCPLDLDVARAMPLSLLCYEVILNSMKHAWAVENPGTLTIEILKYDDQTEIRISDDGIGFAADTAPKGLGSRLISALAREAGTTLSISSSEGHGTRVIVSLQ